MVSSRGRCGRRIRHQDGHLDARRDDPRDLPALERPSSSYACFIEAVWEQVQSSAAGHGEGSDERPAGQEAFGEESCNHSGAGIAGESAEVDIEHTSHQLSGGLRHGMVALVEIS